MSTWKEDYFSPAPKQNIFFRALLPERPRGHVMVIHGYAEHSGRYLHVMEYLAAQGYACYASDHRGHGKTARHLGDMDSFAGVLDDLIAFKTRIAELYGASPAFFLGHSLGGSLAVSLGARSPEACRGVIAIAPTIIIPDYVSPALIRMSKIIAALFPRLQVQRFQKEYVSHDEAVLEAARKDPLYYRGKIKARTGLQLIRAIEITRSLLGDFRLPLLLLHAGDDRIMPKEGSQFVHDAVSSQDKTLRVFDGLYHEILNEPQKETVLAVILDWINGHNR